MVPSFIPVVAAWHASGIIPVFALGNNHECDSTGAPGNFPNVIGVGATDVNDTVSNFSSRGPAPNGLLKPDISAPGANVLSAGIESDDHYRFGSGTSMSAPAISGVIALLKSRDPSLTFDQIKHLLQDNAEKKLGKVAESCGGIPADKFPNNIYGHGRVNALASLTAAINNGS